MSHAKLTPGARLLRSSRMFSLPKPLPTAEAANSIYSTPASATTPYPTSQAISSPYSSRQKGDWGLKRPLPLKTTLNTSTPMIRVKAIDTVEKLTDFSSASDLGLTLEKFQELGIALTMPTSHTQRIQAGRTSVFEEDRDFTAIHDAQPGDVSHQRWKFKGPWLGSMTPGRFEKYISNLKNKREEFRQFLRLKLAQKITEEESRMAVESGYLNAPTPKTVDDITLDQLNEFVHRLRDDSSRYALFSYVGEFLDLPPISAPDSLEPKDNTNAIVHIRGPYTSEGPPKCHPSAGLSYLRTSQFLRNHPLYGPQKYRITKARILTPWKGMDSPKLGVAGIVADVPLGQSMFNVRGPMRSESEMAKVPGILNFNQSIEGGAKVHVLPKQARIDARGKIILTVDEVTSESKLVFEEFQGRSNIYRYNLNAVQNKEPTSEKNPLPMPVRRPRTQTQYQQTRTVGSVQNYGLGQ